MNGSFYRIHANAAGAGNVPDGAVGQTGLCRESEDDAQIGCLTDSDPCSIGYSGREAAKTYPGLGTPAVPQPAPLKAPAVNGIPPFTPASVSVDPDLALENLLQPPGTAPLYPLAHRLYLSTLYGFGNLKGGERELAQCFANNRLVGPAIAGQGFVAIPGGVQCLDYPESAVTATPLANIQGTGNVALGGCGLATNNDACATSGPTNTN